MDEKKDKRYPYSMRQNSLGKLNLLRTQYKTTSLQDTIDSCIEDCYNRHYRSVITEAGKLAEPQNAINASHGRERIQG